MNLSLTRSLLGAGLITLFCTSAQGLEFQSIGYAESRYSDNAGSLKQQRLGDVRNSVGLEAQLTEQRQSIEADVSVTMEHERYMKDTSGDRTAVTSGLGMLNLDLIEDLVHWETSYTRVRVLEDVTQDVELDSRNYRNTLLSGPKITAGLTDTTALEGHVHYVNVENSDEAASDSERANTGLSLLHHYNQLTQFDLSTQYETMLTEDELDPYDRKSASIGITRALVRGQILLNVGRSSLTPEFGDSIDSNFYEIGFRRDELFDHVLQIGYTQDVSDTTIGFDDEIVFEEDTGELPDNDFVTRKLWTGSLSRTIGVHSYTLSASRSDSQYELSRQQTLSHSGSIRYERPVILHLIVGGSLSYSRRNYLTDQTLGVQETTVYTADSTYQFTERLHAGSFIRFISRTSSGTQGRDYEEFQLGVDLRYQLF